MFVFALYTCNDKKVVRLFRAQFRECPACGRLEQEQQSCKWTIKIKVSALMITSLQCLLLIDFTFFEGRDRELVVKELAVVDFHSNRVSSYGFVRPYSWEDVPAFNARMNQAIDHVCNWNDGDVLH